MVLVYSLATHRTESLRDVGKAGAMKGRERENIRQVSKEGYEGASDTESENEDEDEEKKKKKKKKSQSSGKKHKKSE